MEEDQEKKFVCKVCSKICSSGRSLGGHMRGHMGEIPRKKRKHQRTTTMEAEDVFDADYEFRANSEKALTVPDSTHVPDKLNDPELDLEGCLNPSYVLRENPKKSWRVSESEDAEKGNPVIRQNEKGSIKPAEANVCKECGKGFCSIRALYGHMRHHPKKSRVSAEPVEKLPDYHILCPIRRKRSRNRYRINGNLAFSNLRISSCVSELDEAEEAAMCLMMLSRGLRDWTDLNPMIESSENCSVISKPKNGKLVCNVDETMKGFDSCVSCSGYAVIGMIESEFDDLDSGFLPKNDKSAFEAFTNGHKKHELESSDAETGSYQVVSEMMTESTSLEVAEFGRKCWESKDGKDHECQICFKVFGSGQALGGHKRVHYTGPLQKNTRESLLTNADARLKPWWAGGDHERETMMVITN